MLLAFTVVGISSCGDSNQFFYDNALASNAKFKQNNPKVKSYQDFLSASKLDLSHLGLKRLPHDFGSLQALEELYVHGNNLKTLPESINNLTKLKVLNASSNILENIPEIGNLKSLEKLVLLDNRLTDLPKSIHELSSLKELNLCANRLTSLSFPRYTGKLEFLCVSGNRLGKFEELLTLMRTLRVFHERYPAISLQKLQNLKELNLSGGRLVHIPANVFSLSNMKRLDISNNFINRLNDNEIVDALNLTVFIANKNSLQYLPDQLGLLPRLQRIYVTNNQIRLLPVTLIESKSITLIDLSGNKVEEVPKAICNSDIQILGVKSNVMPECP